MTMSIKFIYKFKMIDLLKTQANVIFPALRRCVNLKNQTG